MEAVNLASLDYNQYAMQEIGRTIADDPQKLIDLLESNDFEVDPSISPIELGDAYLYELPYSDGLKLGTAYLIEKQNSSFSGEVDNENIYNIFDAISDYWEHGEETKSNIGGIIGGIVSGGLGVTDKLIAGQQKKRFGALDLATKQADSRQALISGIIAQKQAQALAEQKKVELEAKQRKTTTIAVASVIGALIIIGAVIYFKKQKNG
jgi:hypothetical protein